MKKSATIFVLFSLILTVAVSGCVQFGQEKESAKYGKGVLINNFEAFPSEVFSGEEVDLVLDVQNKGGRVARDIEARIFSLGGMNCDETETTISRLDPPTEDFEGEVATRTFTCTTPSVPGGVESEISPTVRVYYNYSTAARVPVPVLERDEYRRRLRRDESLPSLPSTTVSNGPLSVKIKSRSPAVVQSSNTEDERRFRLSIEANNLLSGTVYNYKSHPDPDQDDYDVIHATVSVGKGRLKCSNKDWEDDGVQSLNDDLRAGKTLRISCNVELDRDQIRQSMEIPVQVDLAYGYFLSESASFTVVGEQ